MLTRIRQRFVITIHVERIKSPVSSSNSSNFLISDPLFKISLIFNDKD